ncbi:transporter substrate-binding domain-containing protein [Thalassotalea sp. G2M2-11]|uniref:transporter substrate-binding domain-containing protein n=1 Tax=Thalassotalea sp. G2M2-11 TaxID=2787627 RepID=UPI0019D0D172|nr:transporter substrate-binding domain-containing protein [Thalassotalea sp. G2M2-11]
MRTNLITILLMVILNINVAAAKFTTDLSWGYIDFKPYHYSVNNKVQGKIAETVEQIFTNANLNYSTVKLPNKRAKYYVDQGRIGFTTVIESFVKNSSLYLRSTKPIYTITLGAICLDEISKINTIDDLKEIKLILLSGYTYGLDKKIDNTEGYKVVLQAQNHESAIKALIHNRADCVLGYEGPFLVEKAIHQDVKFYFHQIDSLPVYLFLNKNIANSSEIMKLINNAIH